LLKSAQQHRCRDVAQANFDKEVDMGNILCADNRVGKVSARDGVSMGGDDAGDQGQSQTCAIYSLNNTIEDRLRCLWDVSDYDVRAAVAMMREQGYESNGGSIEDNGTTMENLVALVNASIDDGMVLPTKDGRGVTFQVSCEFSPGPENAEPSDIVIAKEYDGRGNHFMEVESYDGETIYTQNSWASEMKTTVPDDDDFESAIGIYKIALDSVQKQ